MKPFTHRYKTVGLAIALALLALPKVTCAGEVSKATEQLHLRYEAYWGGIHIADFTLSMRNGGDTYENRFHLETRGLTRYFTNMGVKAISTGRIIQPPESNGVPMAQRYVATHYRTEYTNTKHHRWVDITFNQPPKPAKAVTGTSPVTGREKNWNPKDKGPEILNRVEPQHRIGVNDPISLIPQIMAVVRTHLAGGAKTGVAKGFDGRRRFDMHITYLGKATRTIAKTKHETYRVRIDPQPVAGFKKRHKILWNGAAYDFYISRDGNFLPLQIVPVKHGPVLTMIEKCPSECELKAGED
ncbi:MAG: DUF3108 domain-containing protein [Magnetovibrio sp.]|nr:DUF3108 domain-containing protein [Magnetovibrio sp.]